MLAFLEGYRNGEHAEVWSGLERLGESVRDEPYVTDAAAVAEETMKRARHDSGADRRFRDWHKTGFVNYLRTAFR
jgi:hypothetical protein